MSRKRWWVPEGRTMNRDPLIVAARMLAFVWYVTRHKRASHAEAGAWALNNYVVFLADASEVLGRAFQGEELTPEEREQAETELSRAKEQYQYN